MLSLAQASYLIKHAPGVFGRLFDELLLGCYISQGELSRRATEIRNAMKADGSLAQGETLGSMARPTISYVIDGHHRPGQGQLLIWLEALKEWCDDSPDMLAKVARLGVLKPRYPFDIVTDHEAGREIDLEKDLYRLALMGTIDEIYDAYEYWKDYSLFDFLKDERFLLSAAGSPNTDEIPNCSPYLRSSRIRITEDQVRKPELQH